ncbi:MAG: hypothetical protein P0120_20545 [Nitrospira sp.]|nr:hypothetical protein [Nitrospira sp.]
MGPHHARATGGIGKGPSSELTVRQDIPDLVIAIGDRERCAPGVIGTRGRGQPIEGIVAKVLIAIDRIRDQIYIPIGGKGIGEVLIQGIGPLLGLRLLW